MVDFTNPRSRRWNETPTEQKEHTAIVSDGRHDRDVVFRFQQKVFADAVSPTDYEIDRAKAELQKEINLNGGPVHPFILLHNGNAADNASSVLVYRDRAGKVDFQYPKYGEAKKAIADGKTHFYE